MPRFITKHFHKAMVALTLPLFSVGTSWATPTVSARATLSVNGTEQFSSGAPDSGDLTVNISGYTETIHYGQYSSPASLAAGLAAMFCHDYIRYGLYAKAGASNNSNLAMISFELTNGQAFSTINYTSSSSSFGFNSTGFTAINPPATPPTISDLSLHTGPPQMGFVITGSGFGALQGSSTVKINGLDMPVVPGSWNPSRIVVQVPTAASSGKVVVKVNGLESTGTDFMVATPFGCSTN